ncbi:tetratricopeptide repeat protein [Sphingomonas sp. ID0503]|uniref:tetratricopeptide repeat protein n=1 Tax=Sphingomonas sp. ID0503 TaxID=3399691 RepID=UPI003AFA90BB
MIPFLLMTLADISQPLPPPDRLRGCLMRAESDPAKAAEEATEWKAKGGGIDALRCLGTAETNRGQFPAAAAAFESAADLAEKAQPANAPVFWTAAGNAALAAGEAGRARTLLTKALDHESLAGPFRGETLLDRGRADVQAGDPTGARADIDEALKLVPEDPMAWLLSATLARRQGEAERAEKDIAEAVRLAPDAAQVALEAGNVAAMIGADDAARVAWTRAVAADPSGEAGRAAQRALAGLDTSAKEAEPK